MLKDIHPGTGSADPSRVVTVGNTLYFAARNAANGAELWRSNGTAAGTVLVRDILAGTGGSAPGALTSHNGTLFFIASNGTTGRDLWKSDGTAAGTVRVKDLPAADADILGTANTTLYLYVSPASGTASRLWKSDGTAAGTVPVEDAGGILKNGRIYGLINVNGTAYFMVETETAYEVWKSNGTNAGTVRVSQVTTKDEGREDAGAGGLMLVNGTIYYEWQRNGSYYVSSLTDEYEVGSRATPGGGLTNVNGSLFLVYYNTNLALLAANGQMNTVKTFPYAPFEEGISNLCNVNGTLYFTINNALWKSDKTGSAVVKVKDLDFGFRPEFTSVGGKLYFLARETGSTAPARLWVSDGTGTGTRPVSSPAAGVPTGFENLQDIKGVLYYSAQTAGQGRELWHHHPADLSVRSWRVNAGGNAFSTLDARRFAADAYFSGGTVSAATTKGIAGTGDDYLYQTGRHGASFAYNFPTGNGNYDVVLHFAETYYGNTVPGRAGSRKFHVNIEGARKLTDYDIFAQAGGALRVAQETFRVTVSDGTLNVNFVKGAADNPAIKAIEVLTAGSGLAINAGGSAFVSSTTGKRFAGDVYYASGAASSISSGEIANTADDGLYRNARVGVFSYGLPSGNGTFNVTLHFAETYFGSRTGGGAGSRKFNVFVENVKRLSDYDVFADAGGAMRAVTKTIQVTVTDGVLNLYFAKGSADNPLVSAIEVVPAALTARMAADEPASSPEDGQATLYPNPVASRITVRLPFPADRVRATAVVDAVGNAHLRNAHQESGANELRIEAGGLPAGVYFLKIDTGDAQQIIRFVRQ
ncbi:MAG: T9SS type A sorting domain-containing protein [Cytophagales bacterium]|nr:T9SS type A sorting domain-containing protein [Cytophagales bacterium]